MSIVAEDPAYVCEHCGTTVQWACPCGEAEAARYHHTRAVAELVEAGLQSGR